jgi:anhydro-N-acetylmuramic acid kinase
MNPVIARLYQIAQQPSRRIVGLMSGTSLDGLDIALCHIEGQGLQTRCQLEAFTTVPYTRLQQVLLRQVLHQRLVSIEKVTLLHTWLAEQHATMLLQTLEQWGLIPTDIDCVASHGHTLYHAPKHQHRQGSMPNATLQIGEADHLATRTGLIVISDFRQKHVAHGGEGAPLVAYGDYWSYRSDTESRVLLNIGGISNATYLPAGADPALVWASDLGPGNALIDTAMRHHYQKPYDDQGAIAATGKVNPTLLAAFKDEPFFDAPLPKTTGLELFDWTWVRQTFAKAGLRQIPPQDLVATLTQLSAEVIAEALHKALGSTPVQVYVSGGGAYNDNMMERLRQALPAHIQLQQSNSLGIAPEAKEAVLFALLANETLTGQGLALGPLPAFTMGKISLPS